jgi:curved DNA-binding protein
MEFKDYYSKLGVAHTATQDEIKRAYRKLARKFHPDVSKEPDAEAQFKEVAEAYAALGEPDKRAAYDEVRTRYNTGAEFNPPPGWASGFEFAGDGAAGDHEHDVSDFFEALFGRGGFGARGPRAARNERNERMGRGIDHHAKVQIELQDSYRGGRRTILLRVPQHDAQGRLTLQDRQLEVTIPKGVRGGQHLRLSGQGGAGADGAPSGDLYLEIVFAPAPPFRVEDRDVFVDLPVAPWEAALGASVTLPTPDGSVQLSVPAGSSAGRKLRLKGRGLPSDPPGDLYAVLSIALPSAVTPNAQAAYRSMAQQFADFNPRGAPEAPQ